MALIGSIRKNGWILIVTMVLALGGFILMDVVSNAQRYQQGDVNTLAKVNGVEIKHTEFDTYEKLIYGNNAQNNPYQLHTTAWNYFVENAVVTEAAEKLGLGVSKEELLELEFGTNLSPVIAERFRGPDGQPNRQQLAGIRTAIEGGQFDDPQNRAYWSVQEKEIVKKKLEEKVISLVSKGLFTPLWQAEMMFKETNERMDFKYVRIPFEKVKDEEAQVTDADYATFLSENPKLYDQTEESRTLTYVSLEVAPTSLDSTDAMAKATELANGLRTATNDSVYVTTKGGTYDASYKLKADLPVSMADTLMKLPVGTIAGPYKDGGFWNVIKIVDRKVIPDSVRARHILIREANLASENRIDSIMALIKGGQRFDSLAVKTSMDTGSGAKGGDLGWFPINAMVPEFNNVCFYTGEQGKLYKVATQFGWHLIEITGKKFIKNESGVKSVVLQERIVPSTTTQQLAKDRITALMQQSKTLEDLRTAAAQQGFNVQNTPALKANDFNIASIGTGDDARAIVRWAFGEDVKAGQMAKEVFVVSDPAGGFFDSKYVLAGVKSVAPKGKADVNVLKSLPDADLKVKNRKKGEVITTRIQNAGDLGALAAQWGVQVDTAKGATMVSGGSEPRMVGTVFAMAKDQISKPVIGNNGVYILSPFTDKLSAPMPQDMSLFRKQATNSASNNVRQNLIKSLIKNADTVDNRSRFF